MERRCEVEHFYKKGFAPKAYEIPEVIAELTREVRDLSRNVEYLMFEIEILLAHTGLTGKMLDEIEEGKDERD